MMRYLSLTVFSVLAILILIACDSSKPIRQQSPQIVESKTELGGPVEQFASWLLNSGLGKGLKYVRHNREKDQRIILNLGFRGEKKSAKALWDNLQAGFESVHGESLREALYRKTIF